LPPSAFTVPVLKKLFRDSFPQRRELITAYDFIPPTRCRRQTRCCSLLPEITLLEGMQVMKRLIDWPGRKRTALIKKIVRYFFLNPVKITTCPFLQDRDCLIYRDRFFGCRAYGLWSKDYYQDLVEKNQQVKQVTRQLWERMGVALPEEVIHFQVPYCSRVEPLSPAGDEDLLKVSERIEALSLKLDPWHQGFKETYFSDFSFLVSGLCLGVTESVGLKFNLVRHITQTGNPERLDQILEGLPDPFESFLDLASDPVPPDHGPPEN
jgi:hypothetical protein